MSEEIRPQWQYSAKIEDTAKGEAKVTIHVYGKDMETVRKEVFALRTAVKDDLAAGRVRSETAVQDYTNSTPVGDTPAIPAASNPPDSFDQQAEIRKKYGVD